MDNYSNIAYTTINNSESLDDADLTVNIQEKITTLADKQPLEDHFEDHDEELIENLIEDEEDEEILLADFDAEHATAPDLNQVVIVPAEFSDHDELIIATKKTPIDAKDKSYDPTDIYLKEIGAAPLLSKDEEVHYGRLALQGDVVAKKRMIESNLRLVVKIARRYIRSGMAILDLIEEGNLGLIRAVEKFDPERGFRFSTYGAWWIQQTIERAIMSQSRTIRLPVHIVKRLNSFLRANKSLMNRLDHEPSIEEVANELGVSHKEVEKMLLLNERVVTIDGHISEDINKPLLDTIGSDNHDPQRIVAQDNLKHKISQWLHRLSYNQRTVIEYRFGLNGHEATTLEETGSHMGITRERVRQLQTESLRILRDLMHKTGIHARTILN